MSSYEIFLSPERTLTIEAGKVEEDKKAVTFFKNGEVVAKFYLGTKESIMGYQKNDPPEPE